MRVEGLKCDWPDCNCNTASNSREGVSPREVRIKEAAVGSLDLCPTHDRMLIELMRRVSV